MNTAIAWLGLGNMGAPMARRLLDDGNQLTVWNRSPQRAGALVDAGARMARSPAAAAADADLVVTMLSDSHALSGVLFGDNGALAGLRPGGILVQMSTIGPRAVRELVARMPEGTALVDAPVVGSTPSVAAGSLVVLTGGSTGVLDRVEPVLAPLGTVRRCGDVGTASAVKVVVNTGMLAAVAGLAEALALADAVGVSREIALEAMRGGPLAGVVGRVTGAAQYSVALAKKDLRLGTDAAGLPMPMTESAISRLDNAIAAGKADHDIAVLV